MRTIIILSLPDSHEAAVKQGFASIPLLLIALGAGFSVPCALAADDSFALTIQNHRFDPAQLEVPAGKKLKLVVKNLDPTPEEFESRDLKREKIIAGKTQATITLGPLKPGTYKFTGEYHEATAQGQIVAK
jgi:plastocyanin